MQLQFSYAYVVNEGTVITLRAVDVFVAMNTVLIVLHIICKAGC